MKQQTQHVISNTRGGWSVKKGGAKRAARSFSSKKEAVKYGKSICEANHAELIVHRPDGTIQEAK